MKKVWLSVLLCVTLLLSVIPLMTMANTTLPDALYGAGDSVLAMDADASTKTPPSVFGRKENDGFVWTDKTVEVNGENFDVTLSALAQEYSSSYVTEGTNSTPADVTMILDISGSMRNNTLTLDGDTKATRTKAMVKAVNEAMEIIMTANPKNRVVIYTFHTDNDINSYCDELLALGHYDNPSWTAEGVWSNKNTNNASGKYFNYSVSSSYSSSNDKISTASGLRKDGKAVTNSVTTSSGTCTQQGIVSGVNALTSAIKKETHTVDRQPYVFLFTDGAPGAASKNWYSTTPTEQNRTSHYNEGNAEVTALSILSAAISKATLDSAYDTYNGFDVDVEWFNLGLAVGDNDQGRAFMNPTTVEDGTSSCASDVKSYISTYTSGKTYGAYAAYANNYVYAKDHVVFADTGDELLDAFQVFAKLIRESSKEIKLPIVSVEGENATNGLTFTDVIGDGMTVSGITLHKDASTVVNGVAAAGQNETKYTFAPYATTATMAENADGETVLTWVIPPEEVAMYTFADRTDLDNGNYNAADPIRLSYTVSVTDKSQFDGTTLYTNAFDTNGARTTAAYAVAQDNPYYYTVENDENGAFVSSTIKPSAFEAVNKAENVTASAAYVSADAYVQNDTFAAVTTKLGNNGAVFAVADIDKAVSADTINAGDEFTYTVSVSNRYTDALQNVVVTDALPSGVTYVNGSVNGAQVAVSGQTLTFTVGHIAEGATATITYRVKAADRAATGTVYTNRATLTEIGGVTVSEPPYDETDTTVVNKFGVAYEWDGTIPSGVTLPTDDTLYVTGSAYPVDGTYTANTKIEHTDAYGNVTERWTFSGWDDPNGGVMGYEDVLIEGTWTYESFTVTPHNVIYEWDGTIPSDATLPTDPNSYVNGQGYTVDTVYTSATTVPTYDVHGNQNGYYAFSGWTDPNGGVMGDSDVTVKGTWGYVPLDVPSHGVTYDWGTDVPDGVTLPTDPNGYVNGAPYDVDDDYTDTTTVPTYDEYSNQNGVWEFSGWDDPNDGVMGDEDVTITGKWVYTPQDVPTHGVTYEWTGDVPQNAVLPTDDGAYVNGAPYTVDTTYPQDMTVYTYDEHGNKNGVYTFSGWNDPNGGVMGDSDVTVRGVWTYEALPVPEHGVTYDWGTDAPDGVTLPTDDDTYVKNEQYPVDDDYTDTTTVPTYDEYGNQNGVWEFSGWDDPNGGVMGDEDVTVTGDWEYTPIVVPEHGVIYDWGTDVPDGVTLPTDDDTYVKNEQYPVDDVYSDTTTLPTYDEYGNQNGVWDFSGWTDPNGGVMGDEDVTVTGNWVYTPMEVPTHGVTYDWGTDVPDGVTLPTDGGAYVYRQPYDVDDDYTDATTVPTYDEHGNQNGVWTFSGWTDPNDGVMGHEDVTVTGKWEFTPIDVPEHGVTYDWGTDAPDGVTLPTDDETYVKNEQYPVDDDYTDTTTVPTYDEYGNQNGVWEFSGWTDPNGGVMGDEDVTVTGDWKYTPIDVPTHGVTYEWTGDVPQDAVLPTDDGAYVNGAPYTVDTVFTATSAVYVKDAYGNVVGVYTFSGWDDPNGGVMGDEDVTVRGVWKYEPVAPNEHVVLYDWGTVFPEGEVLPTDPNRYVTHQPYNVDTVYTDKTTVPTYDERGNQNGVWTFSGWTDPNNGVMGDSDVTVTGKWEFTPIKVPTHTVTYKDGSEEVEHLLKIKVYPNGGKWVYENKVYEGDDFAVIIVTKDIDIPDPTREGYTFTHWKVLEEEGFVLVLEAQWVPTPPQTGNENNAMLWLALAMLSLISLTAVLAVGKKTVGAHTR